MGTEYCIGNGVRNARESEFQPLRYRAPLGDLRMSCMLHRSGEYNWSGFQLCRTDRLPSRMSHSQTARTRLLHIGWVNTLLFGFFLTAFNVCLGQTRDVVCDDGYGRFETKFVSGVIVTVGAAKSGGLAKRSCRGTLAWDAQDLPVIAEASQVDVDVLGVDLGLGVPVVAFQVRESATDWDTTYRIYALRKPPKLLRTIAGGEFLQLDASRRRRPWRSDSRCGEVRDRAAPTATSDLSPHHSPTQPIAGWGKHDPW